MERIDDTCPSPAELANDDDYACLYEGHLFPNLLTDDADRFGGVQTTYRRRPRRDRKTARNIHPWRFVGK